MPLRIVPSRDRTLHKLLGRAADERLGQGSTIWRDDERARSCVFVHEGFLLLRDVQGRGVDLAGPAELTALEALRDGASHRLSAEALGPVTVRRVDGAATLRVLRRAKHTLPLLLDALHAETERARRVAAGAGGRCAAERIAWVLSDLSVRFADPDGWLPDGLPHRILAELAGVHRSTVTTQLNAWIWEGALRQRGRQIGVGGSGLKPLMGADRDPPPRVDQGTPPG